jgi:hypothetical protein
MKPALRLCTLAVLCLLPSVFLCLAGCATTGQRQLDPAGVYSGDKYLWDFDGLVLEVDRACDEIEAFAVRNPAFVAEHANIAAVVEKVRSERKAWLREALVVRDTYVHLRTAASEDALVGRIDFFRALLAEMRPILLAVATSNR